MVSIYMERTFARYGGKICLLTTEVFLCAAAAKLAKSKKLQDWTSRNAVHLPKFLTEIVLPAKSGAYNNKHPLPALTRVGR